MRRPDEDPQAWATWTLLRQGVPADEVRRIVGAGDREIVRRHLELHRERPAERLEDDLRAVAAVERLLAHVIDERNESPHVLVQ